VVPELTLSVENKIKGDLRMTSSLDPEGTKPAREGRFPAGETNRRDEIPQRNGRLVHIPFVAIPVLPVIVIAGPDWTQWETIAASMAAAAITAIGRLAWRFVALRSQTA
jgi:hypothetical protein